MPQESSSVAATSGGNATPAGNSASIGASEAPGGSPENGAVIEPLTGFCALGLVLVVLEDAP